MNTAALIALIACLVALTSASIISDELFAEIKSKATWEAVQHHPRFADMTLEEIKYGLLGGNDISIDPTLPVLEHADVDLSDLPTDFAFFTNTTVPFIKNQEKCGSCWAFSASSVLGYRFGLKENTESLVLSPQQLVSCDYLNMGCNGGMLPTAWLYMEMSGLMQESCYPYTSGAGVRGHCSHKCTTESTDARHFHAHNQYHVKSTKDIKAELVKSGPIQAAFTVYSDFMAYKGGVYTHTTGKQLGGHAVTVVGYGEENGQEYWLVQNSWGEDWGIKVDGHGGFFKIAIDTCGISNSMRAGAPGKISK